MATTLTIERTVIGPLATNAYVVRCGDDCWVIDPGPWARKFVESLRQGPPPSRILLTHGHGDHIGGIPLVKKAFPAARVACPAGDAAMLGSPELNLSANFGLRLIVPEADDLLQPGMILRCGKPPAMQGDRPTACDGIPRPWPSERTVADRSPGGAGGCPEISTHAVDQSPGSAGGCPEISTHAVDQSPGSAGGCPEIPTHAVDQSPGSAGGCPEISTHAVDQSPGSAGGCPEIPTHAVDQSPGGAGGCPQIPSHAVDQSPGGAGGLPGTSIWRVLDTSGHTPGGVSFYCEAAGAVIVGDAIVAGGIGRCDLPGSNEDQLLANIRRNLLSLPPQTRILPGHGEETTVAAEMQSNPYL